MNKVILIDSGVVTHRSIFSWGAEKRRLLAKGVSKDPIPASYTYLNTCYAILKKIGIDRDDIIIIAQDGWNSWRKAFLTEYKGQRQGLRDSHKEINWNLQYSLLNKLEKQLEESTNWHFIKFNNVFNFADLCLTDEGQKFDIENHDIDMAKEFGIESDDIQAVACQYFNHLDKEIILVTIDEDLSQLYYYNNVKIFNPNLKSPTNKAKIGFYKIVEDPLKIKSKKIRMGDTSDNILVDKRHDSIRDVEIRQLIIDLINLPEWIVQPIYNKFADLNFNKQINYQKLPFKNSLGKRFDTIYEQKNIRTWDESVVRHCLKEMKVIEKRSKKSVEELYEKNKNYKKLKDMYEENKKQKAKV